MCKHLQLDYNRFLRQVSPLHILIKTGSIIGKEVKKVTEFIGGI